MARRAAEGPTSGAWATPAAGSADWGPLWEAAGVVVARVRLHPSPRVEEIAGAVAALCGRSPAELLADPTALAGMVHPDDRAVHDAAVGGDAPAQLVVRWTRPREPARWTELTVVPWLDEHDRKVGYLATARDATARVHADEALRAAADAVERARRDSEYFHTLLQTVNDGIMVNDAEGNIEFVNDRLAELLATTPAAMIGRFIFDFMDDASAAAAKDNLKRRRAGAEDQFDFRWRRQDGSEFWSIVSAKPMYGPAGEHRGSLVAVTDITARRHAEDALRRARDELEARVAERTQQLTQEVHERRRAEATALEASRIKSLFLANMSHELRTPLNAIIGYTELQIEERGDDGDLCDDLRRIHGAATHLLRLIDNILDLSKIEAARMEVTRERFVLGELLAEVQQLVLPMAVKHNDRLHVECADRARAVITDRTKVKQVLLNLLSNACKFTRRGDVTLRAAVTVEDGVEFLELDVSDTGPGIPLHRIASLFSAFSQADGSIARTYGGTGLGLAISKELCRLLGGEIAVDSVVGEGATFSVRIPLLAE
jgi:PAS domain S-box-containing protein